MVRLSIYKNATSQNNSSIIHYIKKHNSSILQLSITQKGIIVQLSIPLHKNATRQKQCEERKGSSRRFITCLSKKSAACIYSLNLKFTPIYVLQLPTNVLKNFDGTFPYNHMVV